MVNLFLVCFTWMLFGHGVDSSGEHPSADPSEVQAVSGALQAFELGDFPTEVPSEVKPLLTRFKRDLRDMIQDVLNVQGAGSTSTEVVQQRVLRAIEAEGVTVGVPNDFMWDAYGLVLGVQIHNVPAHSDLIVATTTVSVGCGSDTSFYIFRRTGGSWNLILAQEANDYDDVSGAQANFKYLISRDKEEERLYIVTANENEWCASCWQTLRHKVMRPGPAPYDPNVLSSGEHFFYRCEGYELRLTDSGFSIDLIDNRYNTDFERRLLRFEVVGDDVKSLDNSEDRQTGGIEHVSASASGRVEHVVVDVPARDETQRVDDSSRFSDRFICMLPGPHGHGCWCKSHNECHPVDLMSRCEWTPDCRPELPFLALTFPGDNGEPTAQIVDSDRSIRYVKVGDLAAPGLTVLSIQDGSMTVQVSDSGQAGYRPHQEVVFTLGEFQAIAPPLRSGETLD